MTCSPIHPIRLLARIGQRVFVESTAVDEQSTGSVYPNDRNLGLPHRAAAAPGFRFATYGCRYRQTPAPAEAWQTYTVAAKPLAAA